MERELLMELGGGAFKRTADSLVAKGVDIDNFEKFVLHLQENSVSVNIISVPGSRIAHFDQLKPTGLKSFKGTNSIHQIIYVKGSKFIQARKFSCTNCSFEEECTHYGMGQIELQVESTHGSKEVESHHHEINQIQTQRPSTSNSPSFNKLSVDDVYTESEDEQEDSGVLPQIQPNDYVVVKLASKKAVKYFIGLILANDYHLSDFSVKFLKKISSNKFVFVGDKVWSVDRSDIVVKLGQPLLNNREQYVFHDVTNLNFVLD
ncbi:uncharacterized protein LOC126889790 [Diabrotica virgifera virgifera]|uniref:Uncharacterized protein n=1 Tax=Diabrotica virgifera virgifera TaxID=50390 RepID=A0ABM5KVX3_DIAVI|nr:uncharacterized protein LOC126889790 [Diabrotica virgifera virgifera]